MITYPKEGETFTIDQFRRPCITTPDYYIHVVNDKTGVCRRLDTEMDFEEAQQKCLEYAEECAEGWHIELTIGVRPDESRHRLL